MSTKAQVNKKFKTKYELPVLFFTQLMGIAFGIDRKAVGLEYNIVPADRVLAAQARR